MSTRSQLLLVVAQLGSPLWTGCRSASMSWMGDDCAEEVRCPSLEGIPCHNGYDPPIPYYYCDTCGQSWTCASYSEHPVDFHVGIYGGYTCDCITEDFDVDTSNRSCFDTD